MRENGVLQSPPTQNLQMMRSEPREEDLNVNIMLRSRIATSDNKGKQLEEGGWVRKASEKETGFHLEHVKETFMELKKIFVEGSTLGSHN